MATIDATPYEQINTSESVPLTLAGQAPVHCAGSLGQRLRMDQRESSIDYRPRDYGDRLGARTIGELTGRGKGLRSLGSRSLISPWSGEKIEEGGHLARKWQQWTVGVRTLSRERILASPELGQVKRHELPLTVLAQARILPFVGPGESTDVRVPTGRGVR